MTTTYAPPSLLEWALRYARAGYAIFPLIPGDKKPLVKWREEATTDEEKIRAWWERWPDANIGLPTGEINGLFVVDVDGDEGRQVLWTLQLEHGRLPPHPFVKTPGGGNHRYFRWQPALGTGAGKIGKKIDHRGEGGYVVAPPSRRPEGVYRGQPIWTQRLADPPTWLVDLLTPKSPPKVETLDTSVSTAQGVTKRRPSPSPSPDGLDPRRARAAETCIQRASELEEGERNDGTFNWACALRRALTTEAEWEEYKARYLDALSFWTVTATFLSSVQGPRVSLR